MLVAGSPGPTDTTVRILRMPFMNQLEPESLARHFIAHPPQGFVVAQGPEQMPSFTTDFDVLTTLDPNLRRRIETWPLHARWRQWLRLQTRFIGTTVSEYLCVPGIIEPALLAKEIMALHARACPLLVVKDIPQASPLLDASANQFAAAFASACQAQGCVLLEGQALAWVPIDFDTIEEYLSRLSRSRRRDIRRKLRSRASLDVELWPTGSEHFGDSATLDAFYSLYLNVFEQSELKFDLLTPEFFKAVLQDADSGGQVFLYRSQGRMIGWNLCFEHAGMLVDKYIGLAYPAAREHNLYAVSWIENLAYAQRRGLRCYVAGWTDPEVKVALGARLTFTVHAVHVRNPILRMILKLTSRLFEADRSRTPTRKSDAPDHS